MPNVLPAPMKANANPSKNFFISMLTRDIDLADCILDLLDNSVDGISEAARREQIELDADRPFAGHSVAIEFDRARFSIKDGSGGIPITVAADYAFRFGRPDDAPALNDGTIGLYGIGMKRAIFKMGNRFEMKSSTGAESFGVAVDVDRWRRDPQVRREDGEEVMEWSFDLEIDQVPDPIVGTTITMTELYDPIWRQFENPIFRDRLNKMIARDYAFILSRGLKVTVNGAEIEAVMPAFRESADIAPFKHVEERGGVRIEITCGLADAPPDDTSATARTPEAGVYGWYVVCNDRVVVSADKSAETGWGVKPVPAWHPQFTGFMGVARFESDDPKLLPWKTTKRDVDASNPFYQSALAVMMRATKRLTDYTNARRAESKKAKRVEKLAPVRPVQRVTANAAPIFPAIAQRDVVLIEYARERAEVEALSEALGLIGSSPSEVGIRSFEYCYRREVSR